MKTGSNVHQSKCKINREVSKKKFLVWVYTMYGSHP